MNATKRVLVTGSAGRLGRAAVAALTRRGHQVIGFDVRPTPGLPAEQSVVAGLSDVAALRQAATGVDVLIHLAATPDDVRYPRGSPPDDGDNFLDELVPNNLIGPYHVLEAARVVGVPRLVLVSSGQVVSGHLMQGRIPLTPEAPYQPRYLYACTKVFLEVLGLVYATEHDRDVLVVRPGWCPRDASQVAEIRRSELFQDIYLSPGDAGRFFVATVEAERLPRYAVVYVTSRPTHTLRYDLTVTRELLGWEPVDQWPHGAEDW